MPALVSNADYWKIYSLRKAFRGMQVSDDAITDLVWADSSDNPEAKTADGLLELARSLLPDDAYDLLAKQIESNGRD